MTGKTTNWEQDVLALLFNATGITNIADNTATSPLTNLYISLHTGDPGVSGNQTTSEVAYTGYARVAVARTSGGWTVSGSNPVQVAPVATISFPAGTAGSGTAAYFGVGTASSGTGVLLYTGTVTPNIVCGNGVTPQLTSSSTITES
jgi:hypothetical protein